MLSLKHLRLLACALCLIPACAHAQTKTFALPSHQGAMVLDLTGLNITQTSAKDGNKEIGVRAHDTAHTEMLAFLFLTPSNKSETAASCLKDELKQVRSSNGKFTEDPNPAHQDDAASSTVLITYSSGRQALYKFAGTGDQCLVIQVYADKGSSLDIANASALLLRQHYDSHYAPTAADTMQYSTIRGENIVAAHKAPAVVPSILVPWYGSGGVPLPKGSDWKIELLTTFNHGAQPVAEFQNSTTHVLASFLIVENKSGKPTAEGCRDDFIAGLLKEGGSLISESVRGQTSDGRGGTFATASHHTHISDGIYNHDVFAFAGNKKTCAWIHASTVSGKPDEEQRLAAAIAEFHPDLSYQATWLDYFAMATSLYEESPTLAAPFFDSSLKAMPANTKDPNIITNRRLASDVVTVALERMGNLKLSRTYAQRAISSDPDYPMAYYHLACIDANDRKAKEAQLNLQLAFDHRANMALGEPFPDPTKEPAFLQLKSDATFWTFVQSLSSQLPPTKN